MMIKHCFGNRCIEMEVAQLLPSRLLPNNVKLSKKYKQIVFSIQEIGLVEPIVICILNSGTILKILDGHLRVEAFKELGIAHIPCLLAPDEESYTYNKHVNRLSVLQEQKMLKKAIKSGVSIERLSLILGITPKTLQDKFKLLDGICGEVTTLLADKHIPQASFEVLKKMKPSRQIEVVTIMVNLNNFSRQFALSLLHTTNPELLINPKNKNTNGVSAQKRLERLEKEMASVHVETQKLEEHYAANSLKLIVIRNHIRKLLDNAKILHWLIDNKPDYLIQLKKISTINELSDIQ